MAAFANSVRHGLTSQKGPPHPSCSKQFKLTSSEELEQHEIIAQTHSFGPGVGSVGRLVVVFGGGRLVVVFGGGSRVTVSSADR